MFGFFKKKPAETSTGQTSDRLAELLAIGRAGNLSDAEKDELAQVLNEPILPPTGDSPRFVSKHKLAETDLVARIRAIDWFRRCGEAASFDVTMNVERVKSWTQAMAACQSPIWEDVTLEAQNQLTCSLHSLDREKYRQWNEITDRFKNEVITPHGKSVWEPFQREQNVPIKFVHCVQRDILGAMMENAYLSSNHGSYFFLELFLIYEAGHFPCGWRGDWPSGRLVVY